MDRRRCDRGSGRRRPVNTHLHGPNRSAHHCVPIPDPVRPSCCTSPSSPAAGKAKMHLSENEGIEGEKFVVTGGLGYVGAALCLELLRRGAAAVISFDNRPTSSSSYSQPLLAAGVRCILGDVRRKKDVEKALRGATCVFHLASYGMSGKEMIQEGKIDDININGTCNLLEASRELGIKRFIYVSTYNVTFGGNEILNGDERLPYFPISSHLDAYGRSKSIAEQLVLKANGSKIRGGDGENLYTCAIRPAAIYGPGEERHLRRILSLAKMGLSFFKIGNSSVKTDWVYIDNLVLALILASMGLLLDIPGRQGKPVAAGQAYFICDGLPVNTFEFIIKPLFSNLEYDVPKITLEVPAALFISRIILFLYACMYPWLDSKWIPQPVILPTEVYKVGVTHYFSILKAREELGYVPCVSPRDGMVQTVSYWKERKRKELDGPAIYTWMFVIVGLSMVFCAAFLPPIGPLKVVHAISLFFLRSIWTARLVFIIAAALHVGEGLYAWFLAIKIDPENAGGWLWQTIALGFFSLSVLLKRARAS